MGRRAEAQPLVSVLLPVYNAGATLPEALETLIAQTYPRWEVCLVDDGSTDGSPSIAEAFASRDGRIRISRGPHRGIVEVLNAAARMARGDLFMRMDADDRCHPERAERLVRFLAERPDVGLAGSLVRLFPREAVGPGMRYYERWLNGLRDHRAIVRELYVECPLAHPSMVIRRELFERLGGYEDHRWPEDYDLVLRAHRAGTRFGKVERVLLDWRESPGRLSKTDGAYAPDRFLACKVHYLAEEHFADRSREAVIWGAGPDGKRLARALIGAGIALRAFIEVDPRKIGQTIHGAPVWSEGDIERARDALNLAAVGQKGARKIIRRTLDGAGFVEGRSYVCTR
jgi:glycosyltransferase involved in cell wall biosynthesis